MKGYVTALVMLLCSCASSPTDPTDVAKELSGTWERSDDGNTDFIEIELKPAGTYVMETGIDCAGGDCPSTRDGEWQVAGAFAPTGVGLLTIGDYTYQAYLSLSPKKQLRLRRVETGKGMFGGDSEYKSTYDAR